MKTLEEKFVEIALAPFGLVDKFIREYQVDIQEDVTIIIRKGKTCLTDKRRRFRVDFADPENKVAVEIDGGVWLPKGGHTSASGKMRDNIKSNILQSMGWVVFRYSTASEMEDFVNNYSKLLERRKQ